MTVPWSEPTQSLGKAQYVLLRGVWNVSPYRSETNALGVGSGFDTVEIAAAIANPTTICSPTPADPKSV